MRGGLLALGLDERLGWAARDSRGRRASGAIELGRAGPELERRLLRARRRLKIVLRDQGATAIWCEEPRLDGRAEPARARLLYGLQAVAALLAAEFAIAFQPVRPAVWQRPLLAELPPEAGSVALDRLLLRRCRRPGRPPVALSEARALALLDHALAQRQAEGWRAVGRLAQRTAMAPDSRNREPGR